MGYSIKLLAKSTSASVRLYRRENQAYYYSVYPINPDPFLLYEKDLFHSEQTTGIITTDLFQYYGYVSLDCDYRIVIGPSTSAERLAWLLSFISTAINKDPILLNTCF